MLNYVRLNLILSGLFDIDGLIDTLYIMNFVQGTVDILQKYPVPECDIWFIKFSCDFHYKTAAVGKTP